MAELVAESKILQVNMQCDKCGGLMKYIGGALMSDPPLYPHKCQNCGVVERFRYIYPYQRLVTIENPREPVGAERNPDE
ncbi:hypothetical protein B5F53_12050 [Blautia sp. An249]|uniref:hypothetical protein n=1 Tax=Blautia sp. An249 TaxID=1965603 RepID=UPI000B39B9D3|nr:hypothetical protein [Blautia sp. An249]OUO77937.1 hypothetical protein B5F53_12050 [Blautia sp. An249]